MRPLRFYAPPTIPFILLPFLLRFTFISTYRRSLESSMGCLLCILPTWPLPDFIRTKPDVIRVTATKSSSKPALSRLSWPHLLTEGNAVRARRACLWQALPLAECLAMTKRTVTRFPATPNDRHTSATARLYMQQKNRQTVPNSPNCKLPNSPNFIYDKPVCSDQL